MPRILLAEDDDSLRAFLARGLERAGHRVDACPDGETAAAQLNAGEAFDLLLTDIVMPGMDGVELARMAAALPRPPRIIFITGFAAVALGPDGRAPAGARVLAKPIHLKDLALEVDRVLGATQLP